MPTASHALAKAPPKRGEIAHHLAGRLHLRAEQGVFARELLEGEDGRLDEEVHGIALGRQPRARRATPPPRAAPRPAPSERRSPWTRTEPCARRAGSPPERRARSALRGELDVDEAADRSAPGEPARRVAHLGRAAPECTFQAGSTEKESPEWIPASSMCCWMPPIQVSVPSESASTSYSNASSRNRSISTGCSGELSRARAM